VVCILARARNISLLQNAQTTSGDLPASYSTDTVSFTLGVKWLGHEKTTHLHLLLRLRRIVAIAPLPLYAFMIV